ncbi:MAG: prepilin-type N-terminal cleavage/methylation domain-containing protein [Candidatus Omnitrophota bacterium]
MVNGYKKLSTKGFTILEILVVISVIAILIGIAVPRFKGMQDAANIIKVKSELKTIQSAMESYKNNHTSYPSTLAALETAVPQIIDTGMVNPLSSANYKMATMADATIYYAVYAPSVSTSTLAISALGVIRASAGSTLDVYCVTNGTFNCNN